jgi:hypothetical protein
MHITYKAHGRSNVPLWTYSACAGRCFMLTPPDLS